MLLHPRLLLRCHQMMYLLSTILSSARGWDRAVTHFVKSSHSTEEFITRLLTSMDANLNGMSMIALLTSLIRMSILDRSLYFLSAILEMVRKHLQSSHGYITTGAYWRLLSPSSNIIALWHGRTPNN
jgi:hypothetical protein